MALKQIEVLRKLSHSVINMTKYRPILYYSRYGSWDMFSMVQIETLTACNRRCHYCPNSKFDRGLLKNSKRLKTELFKKIINELANLRSWEGDIQPHFYGEPLMDDRMTGLVNYTKKKYLHVLFRFSQMEIF